jgi:hypothetical protein
MAYWLCPQVVFLNKKVFVDDVILGLMEKTMFTYVQLALIKCISTICTFDMGCKYDWVDPPTLKEKHIFFIGLYN